MWHVKDRIRVNLIDIRSHCEHPVLCTILTLTSLAVRLFLSVLFLVFSDSVGVALLLLSLSLERLRLRSLSRERLRRLFSPRSFDRLRDPLVDEKILVVIRIKNYLDQLSKIWF